MNPGLSLGPVETNGGAGAAHNIKIKQPKSSLLGPKDPMDDTRYFFKNLNIRYVFLLKDIFLKVNIVPPYIMQLVLKK